VRELARSRIFGADTAAGSPAHLVEAPALKRGRAQQPTSRANAHPMIISAIRDGDSWEFRAGADAATVAKPGFPECVAMLVQIGDHLGKQYDVKG